MLGPSFRLGGGAALAQVIALAAALVELILRPAVWPGSVVMLEGSHRPLNAVTIAMRTVWGMYDGQPPRPPPLFFFFPPAYLQQSCSCLDPALDKGTLKGWKRP